MICLNLLVYETLALVSAVSSLTTPTVTAVRKVGVWIWVGLGCLSRQEQEDYSGSGWPQSCEWFGDDQNDSVIESHTSLPELAQKKKRNCLSLYISTFQNHNQIRTPEKEEKKMKFLNILAYEAIAAASAVAILAAAAVGRDKNKKRKGKRNVRERGQKRRVKETNVRSVLLLLSIVHVRRRVKLIMIGNRVRMLRLQIPKLKLRELLGLQVKLRNWRLSREDEEIFAARWDVFLAF
jgi:hypothetical protein